MTETCIFWCFYVNNLREKHKRIIYIYIYIQKNSIILFCFQTLGNVGICRGKMAAESNEEYEDLAQKQRLKAALHYAVGQVCREVEGGAFSKELVATISETAFHQCETLAGDLEHLQSMASIPR